MDRTRILALGLVLLGCTGPPVSLEEPAGGTPTLRPVPSPAPTLEVPPTVTEAPPQRAGPAPIPTQTLPGICSPLAGLPLESLPETVANPFQPPSPGSDAPHQGVDLADLEPAARIARPGRAVQAALAGQVAMVLADRFPYGHAVLVETPLESISPSWETQIGLPTPGPTLAPHPALTCPGFTGEPFAAPPDRSLYVLYAHMLAAPALKPGEPVRCGQPLGAIGDSGNALNPHLHLEVRVGPAGARFDSMAHYDSSAQPGEMEAYCTWRVSGLFQLVDPMKLLALPTSAP